MECKADYTVVDVISINMTFGKGKEKKNVGFEYTQDHSKWAISDEKDENYVCIADLNRMVNIFLKTFMIISEEMVLQFDKAYILNAY